jgi:hypothetical protein
VNFFLYFFISAILAAETSVGTSSVFASAMDSFSPPAVSFFRFASAFFRALLEA